MRVSVLFFTRLREITGKREVVLEFPGTAFVSLDSSLKMLVERYGTPFFEYVYDPKTGEVKGFLQLLVNGQNVSMRDISDVKLADGDVLAIIPPFGGGLF